MFFLISFFLLSGKNIIQEIKKQGLIIVKAPSSFVYEIFLKLKNKVMEKLKIEIILYVYIPGNKLVLHTEDFLNSGAVNILFQNLKSRLLRRRVFYIKDLGWD